MTLEPGQTLSHYRILAKIGAGGMGIVYKAQDVKLRRDVALKVLPPHLVSDPERRGRFLREARSAAAVTHPNIATIHQVDEADGQIFLAMELVEGQTLRALINRGPLPVSDAVRIATDITRGLAHAHRARVVHRDLKPENVIVGPQKTVKILDFGLAKVLKEDISQPSASKAETATAVTREGAILGTPTYMSPEQLSGKEVDHRSDIFSLGAVLYEMLSGARAFPGETTAEVWGEILKEEPAALGEDVPPALDAIVRHCLEKAPEERYQSAPDLAFQLQSAASLPGVVPAAEVISPARGRWLLVAALAVIGLLLGSAGGYVLRQMNEEQIAPVFQRLTFRKGIPGLARFTPDGQSVVYAAIWEDNPPELFSTRLGIPGSRPLDLQNTWIAGVFGGEMAILQGRTLARVSLDGGTPREIHEDVRAADWSPDGESFALVRGNRLEYPAGEEICSPESGGRFAGALKPPRISPDGERVAFIELYSLMGYSNGSVGVADRAGNKQILSKEWREIGELAWSPDGEEIWFTATKLGFDRQLHAVTLSG
jgi:hypothetical protein